MFFSGYLRRGPGGCEGIWADKKPLQHIVRRVLEEEDNTMLSRITRTLRGEKSSGHITFVTVYALLCLTFLTSEILE